MRLQGWVRPLFKTAPVARLRLLWATEQKRGAAVQQRDLSEALYGNIVYAA